MAQMTDFIKAWMSGESDNSNRIDVRLAYIDINDGNLYDGILFSQIMYWHGKSRETGKPRMKIQRNGYLWIVKTCAEWYDECRIDERTARRSLKRIKDKGLIITEFHKFGHTPKLYIRVDFQALEQKLKELFSSEKEAESLYSSHSSFEAESEVAFEAESEVAFEAESIYTETTSTEITNQKKEREDMHIRALSEKNNFPFGTENQEDLNQSQEKEDKDLSNNSGSNSEIYSAPPRVSQIAVQELMPHMEASEALFDVGRATLPRYRDKRGDNGIKRVFLHHLQQEYLPKEVPHYRGKKDISLPDVIKYVRNREREGTASIEKLCEVYDKMINVQSCRQNPEIVLMHVQQSPVHLTDNNMWHRDKIAELELIGEKAFRCRYQWTDEWIDYIESRSAERVTFCRLLSRLQGCINIAS